MSMDRREFFKIAGVTAALGLGAAGTIDRIAGNRAEAIQVVEGPNSLKAKHWAMVIDNSKFKTKEDYQKCIDACHKIHNVPNWGNPKDELKWMWTDEFENSFPGTEHPFMPKELKEKQFMLLCNHCEKPACVRVCPTQATFKRSDGIVMMDFHRCIGCRFCMAACPFGARSFNWRDARKAPKELNPDFPGNPEFPTRTKGVVEKCNFCYERLAVGLEPACVKVSGGALIFGDLDDPNSEVRKVLTEKYTIRRKPELGTSPSVYYVIGG